MPRKDDFPSVTDFASRIGLKILCVGHSVDDMQAHPKLRDFCDRIVKIANDFSKRLTAFEIRESPDIEEAALALFHQYAPDFWKRPEIPGMPRPWLLKAGKGWATKGHEFTPYDKDMYYDDPKDRQMLQKMMVNLVIAKVLRTKKDTPRRSREGVRCSSNASFGHEPELPRPSSECFCGSTLDVMHTDATWLERRKILLCSSDDDDGSVNGQSLNELAAQYFDVSDAGRKHYNAEPVVLDELTTPRTMVVRCIKCASGTCAAELEARCIDFKWTDVTDPENPLTMLKYVWTYPCELRGKKVYALLAEVPARLGTSTTMWRFFKVEGGYTANAFLAGEAGTPAHTISTSINGDKATSGPSPNFRYADMNTDGSPRRSQSAARSIPTSNPTANNSRKRSFDSRNSLHAVEAPHHAMSDAAYHSDASEVPAFPKRFKSSGHGQSLGAQCSGVSRAHGNSSYLSPRVDEDDRHDTISVGAVSTTTRCARPAAATKETDHTVDDGSSGASQAHSMPSSPPRGPAHADSSKSACSCHSKDIATPVAASRLPPCQTSPLEARPTDPPMQLDFRFRVTQRHTPNKRIVKVSDHMSVQELFSTLQQRFNPIVDGKKVITVALDVPDKTARWHIVEDDVDSSETWEEVVSEMKASEKTHFDGVVDVEGQK